MTKILFVCHGNICRSPLAEFLLKDMVAKRGIAADFFIASAATSREELGNSPHPETRKLLSRLGISCAGKKARQMTSRDFDEYDYLIGMDSWNLRNMRRFVRKPSDEEKISRLLDYTDHPRDIADPWYSGDFDATYRDVREGLEAFLTYLGY